MVSGRSFVCFVIKILRFDWGICEWGGFRAIERFVFFSFESCIVRTCWISSSFLS